LAAFESEVKSLHLLIMSDVAAAAGTGQEDSSEVRGKVGRGEAGEGANVDSVEASERQDREDLTIGKILCFVG
jgi:hypothetical protein